MATSSKGTSEVVNFNAASRKITALDQLLKNQAFQKTISQLAAKSKSDREKFASSELTPEALAKKGIEAPKGTKIVFKPATASSVGPAGPQKKKIVVNLVIPEVGTVSFRSVLNDKPPKVENT